MAERYARSVRCAESATSTDRIAPCVAVAGQPVVSSPFQPPLAELSVVSRADVIQVLVIETVRRPHPRRAHRASRRAAPRHGSAFVPQLGPWRREIRACLLEPRSNRRRAMADKRPGARFERVMRIVRVCPPLVRARRAQATKLETLSPDRDHEPQRGHVACRRIRPRDSDPMGQEARCRQPKPEPPPGNGSPKRHEHEHAHDREEEGSEPVPEPDGGPVARAAGANSNVHQTSVSQSLSMSHSDGGAGAGGGGSGGGTGHSSLPSNAPSLTAVSRSSSS